MTDQDPYRWYSVEELHQMISNERDMKEFLSGKLRKQHQYYTDLEQENGVLKRTVKELEVKKDAERVAFSVILIALCVTLFFAL